MKVRPITVVKTTSNSCNTFSLIAALLTCIFIAGCVELPANTKAAAGFVTIAGGTFVMGSSAQEPGRDDDEGPQHEVSVKTFALAVNEVTRREFGEFVGATQYKTDAQNSPKGCGAPKPENGELASWKNPGFAQGETHPVVCVSRNDAVAYAAWKSQGSGFTFRIPTEAEFEHALRAGGQDLHPWGDDPEQGCVYGNIGDVRFKTQFPKTPNTAVCDDGFLYTSPIGSYRSAAHGVNDLSGNVWEWTADCYLASYENAPVDGSARKEDNCKAGVLRGASFDDGPRYQRSANRVRVPPNVGAWVFGIRLAHDI